MDDPSLHKPFFEKVPEVAAGLSIIAALALRLSNVAKPRPAREVLADSLGTAALSFLAFEAIYGSGANIHVAIAAGGVIGALGWVWAQGRLVRWVQRKL